MSHGADSIKTIFFALGANLAIACAKLAAAVVTSSGAMFAEAIHSVADTGNQVLLLIGLKRARLPPSAEHPLGYGKAIYFWSFLVALILFSIGGLVSVYEGLHKLAHPEPLRAPLLAVGVLVFSVVAESVSMWGCLREVNKVRGGRSLWRWFRETRQSELLVVFAEDSAALFGLTLALAAVVLTITTGDPRYDAIGTLCIGALLVAIALFVGVEIKALLIGQGVDVAVDAEMRAFLLARPEVAGLYNLLTLQLGDRVMVAVKARMAPCPSADALVAAINTVEAAFRAQFADVLWLFFEPDNED
ncbi:MAG: cation diffusion facilitator family transporter [Gammaproteobacteria bacterium]|nr:cation diffusion facilitator family transporter [Gammaproteobacteria bacterium]